MTTGIGAIVAGLVTIAVALLKWYMARDTTYADIQKARKDIQDGNVDAVGKRVDGLLVGTNDSNAGEPSTEDANRRLNSL